MSSVDVNDYLPNFYNFNIFDMKKYSDYGFENMLIPILIAALITIFIIVLYYANIHSNKISIDLIEERIKRFIITGKIGETEYKKMPTFKQVFIDTLKDYHAYIAVAMSSLQNCLTISRIQRLLILSLQISFTLNIYLNKYI